MRNFLPVENVKVTEENGLVTKRGHCSHSPLEPTRKSVDTLVSASDQQACQDFAFVVRLRTRRDGAQLV